jgi:pantoate--beta-alanine ligase
MPGKDTALVEGEGCDIVFMPGEKDIYPEPDTRVFDFGGLDTTMEGRYRPGHFRGVAQVVTRLFDIVLPHRAYFGIKDFQQLAIIRKVSHDLQIPVEIIACPIIRESDGLAMSSRNMLLTPEQRAHAPLIFQTLSRAAEMRKSHSLREVREFVIQTIDGDPFMTTEYFEIADKHTLQPAENWNESAGQIGCIAVRVGSIRLIDNVIFSS